MASDSYDITSLTIPGSVDECCISEDREYGGFPLSELILEYGTNTLNLKRYDWGKSHTMMTFNGTPIETIYLGRNVVLESDKYHTQFETPFDSSDLKTIRIGKNVTRIQDKLFGNSDNVTSLTFPAGMEAIEGGAFDGMPNIKVVSSMNSTPPEIEYNTFANEVYLNAILYVPKGSLEAYLNSNWKAFVDIRDELPATGVEGVLVSGLSVTADNGTIRVNGIDAGVRVNVYSVSGKMVYGGCDNTISNLAPGVYIVKVAGQTFKVAL